MPLLYLLIMTFACLPDKWQAPTFLESPEQSAFLVWLGVGVLVLGAALLSFQARHRLATISLSGEQDELHQHYIFWKRVHLYFLMGFYLLALYGLGWGWNVQSYYVALLSERGNAFAQKGIAGPGAELLVLLLFLRPSFYPGRVISTQNELSSRVTAATSPVQAALYRDVGPMWPCSFVNPWGW